MIVDASDQEHRLALEGREVVRENEFRQHLREHRVPIFADDVAVGAPVADDVPEAVEREQLHSRIGKSDAGISKADDFRYPRSSTVVPVKVIGMA
jgi:hypothetical protein